MIGSHWTREEKSAYRSYLSLYRITDEIWIVISLCWFFVSCLVEPMNTYLDIGLWFICGLLVYATVPRMILRALPTHIRERLPVSRFAGPSIPNAFQSYRELVHAWRHDR